MKRSTQLGSHSQDRMGLCLQVQFFYIFALTLKDSAVTKPVLLYPALCLLIALPCISPAQSRKPGRCTPVPLIIACSSTSLCQGQSCSLSASGGSGFTWSTSQNTPDIIVTPAASTIYFVYGLDQNVCASSASVYISVIPNSLTISGSSLICSGEPAIVMASGCDSYMWSTGATSPSISVAPITNTFYTVSGISNGCVFSKFYVQLTYPCVGMADYSLPEEQALLSPNPNRGEFEVVLPDAGENYSLVVYASTGQKVFEQELREAGIKTKLPPGLYYYQLLKNHQANAIHKLIIE